MGRARTQPRPRSPALALADAFASSASGAPSELAATYVGAGIEDNWEALFATTALFRRVATEVAEALGLVYRRGLDETATAYLEAVRDLSG